MIKVVNQRWHQPTPNDVYIGRPSPLGNPYTHIHEKHTKAKEIVSSREEAVKRYRSYSASCIAGDFGVEGAAFRGAFNDLVEKAKKGDINLVCWCAPQQCHGDVLKETIEDFIKPKEPYQPQPVKLTKEQLEQADKEGKAFAKEISERMKGMSAPESNVSLKMQLRELKRRLDVAEKEIEELKKREVIVTCRCCQTY